MHLWKHWPVGFCLTVLLEMPVVMTLLTPAEPKRARRALLFVFANLVTHPLVWFFFPLLPFSRMANVALSELWACSVEAVFYRTMASRAFWGRAVLTSTLANMLSFGLGWLLIWCFQARLFAE